VRLDQPGPLPLLPPRDVPTLLIAELDAGPLRQPLDRLGERQVLHAPDERDDVAALPAAEAEVVSPRRGDVERRALLVVEGAQSLEVATAGVAKLDVFAHDIGDG
jgi:hypothetical protein